MKIEYILDVFYNNGELSCLWTFSTGANIASDMLFINNSFRLLTYISWILVQNNRIWGWFWKSFFWFGENITCFVALTLEYFDQHHLFGRGDEEGASQPRSWLQGLTAHVSENSRKTFTHTVGWNFFFTLQCWRTQNFQETVCMNGIPEFSEPCYWAYPSLLLAVYI